jgi:hypothetical protein
MQDATPAPDAAAAAVPVAPGSQPPEKEKVGAYGKDIPVREPAQIKSQEDLDEVLARHLDWLAAVMNPNTMITLARANLSGTNLTGLDLEGRNLSGANLNGAILEKCNLNQANLTACDLRGANLSQATLVKAKLIRTKVAGAIFLGADLTDAQISQTDVDPETLRQSVWAGAEATPIDPLPIPEELTATASEVTEH